MKHRILSLFPLPLLLSSPLLAQGEVELRTAAKKGTSVWLSVETKLEQTFDMGGRQGETAHNTTRVMRFDVKDVDDKGNLIVATTIARVHGDVTTPGGMADFEFDSAKPAAAGGDEGGMPGLDSMRKAMLAGAGKTFTAKVDSRGKVVELLPDAVELLKERPAGGMMAMQLLNEATLKGFVEGAFGTLPEKPVAVGGKWQEQQQEGRALMVHKVEMTLAKADDEVFEITSTGTVEKVDPAPDAQAPAGEGPQEAMARRQMQNAKISNAKLSGSQRVSRKDGFVVEATSSMSMDVEMNANMAVSTKSTTVTKRSSAEAAEAKQTEPAKDQPKKDEPAKEPGKEPGKEGGK